MQQHKNTSIVWFKNDLRSQDNNILNSALMSSNRVIGIYFLDPKLFETTKYGFKKMDRYRARFLLETLHCLKQELNKLNISLLVFNTAPEHKMSSLVTSFDVDSIFLQKEWTAEEQLSLEKVKNVLPKGIKIHEIYDQFLFDPEDVPFDAHETPVVFTQFRKLLEKNLKSNH